MLSTITQLVQSRNLSIPSDHFSKLDGRACLEFVVPFSKSSNQRIQYCGMLFFGIKFFVERRTLPTGKPLTSFASRYPQTDFSPQPNFKVINSCSGGNSSIDDLGHVNIKLSRAFSNPVSGSQLSYIVIRDEKDPSRYQYHAFQQPPTPFGSSGTCLTLPFKLNETISSGFCENGCRLLLILT
jgi:hypothetical protein